MGYSFQCWFSEHHNRLVPQMFIFRASSIDFPRHLLGWVCICTFVCARVLPSESGITIRFPPYCSCISAPLPLMAWSEHNDTQCYQPSHALTDGCVSPTTASLQYYTHTPAFARRLASCPSGSSLPTSSLSFTMSPHYPLSWPVPHATLSNCCDDRAERMLKKMGRRGVRVIEQNNPIWWPSYYPAIVVQQRKGCRQKFNYLPSIWEGNLNRCRARQEVQNSKCKSYREWNVV